jgi:hypothetical protein
MNRKKHSEATKQKMRETKLKKYAERPMSEQWKEKIRKSNKITAEAKGRAYMILEYGVKFMEAEYGIEYMKNTYGQDYATKYANMDIKTL